MSICEGHLASFLNMRSKIRNQLGDGGPIQKLHYHSCRLRTPGLRVPVKYMISLRASCDHLGTRVTCFRLKHLTALPDQLSPTRTNTRHTVTSNIMRELTYRISEYQDISLVLLSSYGVLPPFLNIRCFRFVKQMYLDMS
jgi:hypothetical protein